MPASGCMSFSIAALMVPCARHRTSHSSSAFARLTFDTGPMVSLNSQVRTGRGGDFPRPSVNSLRDLCGLRYLDDDLSVDLELDGVARHGHCPCEAVPV